MLTNANIMIHSSYDNLSSLSPIFGSTTTNTNPIFDELQGGDQTYCFSFVTFIIIYLKPYINFVFID